MKSPSRNETARSSFGSNANASVRQNRFTQALPVGLFHTGWRLARRRNLRAFREGQSRPYLIEKTDKWNRHAPLLILRRDTPDFFQGRNPFERLFHAHHAQRFHPFANRLIFDDGGRSTLDDQATNRFADRQ